MQPITFKCFTCGKVLGADRYPINPYTCECHERLGECHVGIDLRRQAC